MKKQTFGQIEGKEIEQYILKNEAGMEVKIMTYGATITSISIPGEDRKRIEIACGFDQLDAYFGEAYKANAPYFGCTVGRYASRIKDGKFTLEGKDYTMAVNNGSNHLHGGLAGFDKKVWEAQIINDSSVEMTLESPDMEEGYPGNVKVKVQFSLSENNELKIEYHGTTDKATPLSLTNHTYFNLSGFAETIANHEAKIVSDRLLVPDETNVPAGDIREVSGTEDLRSAKKLGELFKSLPQGFEHFYALDTKDKLKPVGFFKHPASGRKLEISTTEPGVLFYTGFFTSNELKRENGDQFGKFKAFCFETSRYPNGPNLKDAPGSITTPEKPYTSKTSFKFFW
ncbi:aldose epimerase family protein [Flexithrix dorotheae]|uniref:aldose epimerase family protein n=1 Tax=Flexithrix dorotheae TaxID=70993 RepID=UPI00036D60E6|nr:aldose epimerase family protein [Flexithrix dorotheae]